MIDYSKVSDLEFEGIDFNDSPDFCDAFVSRGLYDGEEMTEAQLEELNNDTDFVYEQLMEYLY